MHTHVYIYIYIYQLSNTLVIDNINLVAYSTPANSKRRANTIHLHLYTSALFPNNYGQVIMQILYDINITVTVDIESRLIIYAKLVCGMIYIYIYIYIKKVWIGNILISMKFLLALYSVKTAG
jgi:hypothetical protein